jgi:glutamyl-tRNA(Gln) amidotransferase subunit E
MVLRSTGRVKRGLGTIRQDVNISIRDGARVEIKGVQELDLIAEVVRREVQRQQSLLAIRDELRKRAASVDPEIIDVTGIFAGTKSGILKQAELILAVRLRGFGGILGREIQPGRRLGSEISDYAKKCGVGGIFHTDELPAYGITAGEVERLRTAAAAAPDDCVAIVADTGPRTECAVRQIARRAGLALDGVPEETRKMLQDGSTAYMRPLPGAARMYPETDVIPELIRDARWEGLPTPELLSARADRYALELGLDPSIARQIAYSERLPLFDRAVAGKVSPGIAARTLLSTLKELARDQVPVERIGDDDIIATLRAVEEGRAAKEAIPGILQRIAGGVPPDKAIAECAPTISRADLLILARRIVGERTAFVRERGKGALGPLMGVLMAEVRGSVDGKLVSSVLREEIDRLLSGEGL